MKLDIYNLIILDESGSMGCVVGQTISGCNETINTIKASQEKFADTQNHYVSIYAFQGGGPLPSRYLIKNVPAAAVEPITSKDYSPCGNTPLYDAVGSTLVDLKATVKGKENAIGSVTIITDGYENSSMHYTHKKVADMISALKEVGWNFSFIGANIDVEACASSLNIDNSLKFDQSYEGTAKMFAQERRSRMVYNEKLNRCYDCDLSAEIKLKELKKAARNYFTPDKSKDNSEE